MSKLDEFLDETKRLSDGAMKYKDSDVVYINSDFIAYAKIAQPALEKMVRVMRGTLEIYSKGVFGYEATHTLLEIERIAKEAMGG